MKTILRVILAGVVALGFIAAAPAQEPMVPPAYDEPPRFSQAELDSMLAPIALYPDQMLSQLLMAATFARDVAEAAAWSRANPQLTGEAAVRAVANQPWDPSVKSLVAFPQVLAMMDEHMEWTERLGDAFMANPTQVSDTIQVLRGRADQAGNLRSSEEMTVQRDYGNYVIEPARPDVVYVPYYDPRVVYGPWWWPNYDPVWWSPWSGYAWTPGYAFSWGYGVPVGSGFWYSSFDWPRRYVRFYSHRPYYYRGHSRYYGHRWYSDRDHARNSRNYHWSGYRGNDGRRDWRGDGRGGQRDGRGYQRGDGRGDGRNWQRGEGRDGREGRSPDRAPRDQRYTVPPTGRQERSIERQDRATDRQSLQPLSPGAIAPAVPVERAAQPQRQPVQPQRQAVQPLQRQPMQQERQVAPSAQRISPLPPAAQPAPAPSAPAAARAAPESRPPPSPAREPRPEARAPDSGQERSNNPLGRGGGRADRQ